MPVVFKDFLMKIIRLLLFCKKTQTIFLVAGDSHPQYLFLKNVWCSPPSKILTTLLAITGHGFFPTETRVYLS